jgi:hypothetical protein
VKVFLAASGYHPTDNIPANQELEDFMRAEMESGNFVCDQLERTLRMASSIAEVPPRLSPQLSNMCVIAYYKGTGMLP